MHRSSPLALALVVASLLGALLSSAVGPTANPADAQSVSLPDPERSDRMLRLEPFAQLPPTAGRRMMELTHAGDGSGRGFVPVQEGQIWVINPDGSVPATPMLDLTTAPATANRFIRGCCAFGGLTYIAFHPDYANPGAAGFGLVYTAHEEIPNGTPDYRLADADTLDPIHNVVNHHVIAEWKVRDPLGNGRNQIDGSSYREIYRLEYQDEFGNPHAIGEIAFNPYAQPGSADYGNLYAAIGDGGNGASLVHAPWAQDLSNTFGSLIRIDPLGGPRFGVPGDNPFAGVPGAAEETFAYGLRDPQTFSFAQTSSGAVEIVVAEIGFEEIEEVDISRGGENFGWDAREGTLPVHPDPARPQTPIDPTGPLVDPVAEYDHLLPSQQQNTRALPTAAPTAIIGGFVYEGPSSADLRGEYIFGDLVRGRFFHTNAAAMTSARDNSTLTPIKELLVEVDGEETVFIDLVNPGGSRADLRFGLGEDRELYILNKWDRTIRRIAGNGTPPPLCNGQPATIVGTDGADVLVGTEGDDVIVGLGGRDIIRGNDGNDMICGGADNDQISGDAGWDTLFGEDGSDQILGGAGNDLIRGGTGNDKVTGGDGDDRIFGEDGRDRIEGNAGNDRIVGGNNNDRLIGGSGDDVIKGQGGRDRLFGKAGNDTLLGGFGKDRLLGGGGRDRLNGGPGTDFCHGGAGRDTGSRCNETKSL